MTGVMPKATSQHSIRITPARYKQATGRPAQAAGACMSELF